MQGQLHPGSMHTTQAELWVVGPCSYLDANNTQPPDAPRNRICYSICGIPGTSALVPHNCLFSAEQPDKPPSGGLAPGALQLTCGKHLGLHASSASDQVSMLVDSRSRMLLLLDLMASSAFTSSAWAVS